MKLSCFAYFVVCPSMLFLVVSMFCGILACEFIKLFTFQLKLHVICCSVLCFVFAMVLSLVLIHFGLLGGEFRKLLTFWLKSSCLVHFITFLLVSMHCGLLVGELKEFYKSRCFVDFVVCALFGLFVFFNALCVTRRWVEWIVHILNKQLRLFNYWLVCLHCGFRDFTFYGLLEGESILTSNFQVLVVFFYCSLYEF